MKITVVKIENKYWSVPVDPTNEELTSLIKRIQDVHKIESSYILEQLKSQGVNIDGKEIYQESD